MDKTRLLLALSQGCVDPFIPYGGKPDAPPPPDYAGAATQQGQANIDTARVQTSLNRPDEYTPYGQRTWENLGGDRWSATTQFSPEQQQLYQQMVGNQMGLGNLATTAIGNASDVLSKPVDLSGIPDLPTATGTRDKVYEAMLHRMNDQFSKDEDARRTDLVNRGFGENTEAWERSMDQMERAKVDSRYQADLYAGSEAQREYGMGMDTRRQAITEAMLQRQTPLNEIAALMSGSGVSAPQFQPYYGAGNIAPPPIFNAATAQSDYNTDMYNADVGQRNQLMQTGGALGAAGITALMF